LIAVWFNAQPREDPYTIQKLMAHTSFASMQSDTHHFVGSLRRGIEYQELSPIEREKKAHLAQSRNQPNCSINDLHFAAFWTFKISTSIADNKTTSFKIILRLQPLFHIQQLPISTCIKTL
jgi:hypothetical protein